MTTPLPIHPWPLSDDRLALLKLAKASLGLPYQIVPVEAVHGSPGRVLCFGERPPFVCKTAPIQAQNVNELPSITAAMKFALEDRSDRFDEADWLSGVMGCNVVFSHEEDQTGKVVFS